MYEKGLSYELLVNLRNFFFRKYFFLHLPSKSIIIALSFKLLLMFWLHTSVDQSVISIIMDERQREYRDKVGKATKDLRLTDTTRQNYGRRLANFAKWLEGNNHHNCLLVVDAPSDDEERT